MKPSVTAKQALHGLEIDISDLDIRKPAGLTVLCRPNELFALTLVRKRHPIQKKDGKECNVLHWSGRPFMYEELARFQNLRQDRLWIGKPTECAEMIGDAVPAVPFSAVLKAVAKTLKETDDGTGTISRSRFDELFAFTPFKRSSPSEQGPGKLSSGKGISVSTESRPSSNVSKKRSAPTNPDGDLPMKK